MEKGYFKLRFQNNRDIIWNKTSTVILGRNKSTHSANENFIPIVCICIYIYFSLKCIVHREIAKQYQENMEN